VTASPASFFLPILGRSSRAKVSPFKLRPALSFLVLVGIGAGVNYFPAPLLFGVDFFLGGVAVMIVVQLYPLPWGVFAAICAALSAGLEPEIVALFAVEASFVGLFTRREENLIDRDGVFWIVLGVPLILLFGQKAGGGITHDENPALWLFAFKYAINGVLSAVLAGLLLGGLPLRKWVGAIEERATVSFHQTFLNILIAFVLVPSIFLLVAGGHIQHSMMQENLRRELLSITSQGQSLGTDFGAQYLGQADERILSLIDRNGKTIVSTMPGLVAGSEFPLRLDRGLRRVSGADGVLFGSAEGLSLGAGVSSWPPGYFMDVPAKVEKDARIVAWVSKEPYHRALWRGYTLSFGCVFVALIAAYGVGRFARFRLLAPINTLAQVTTGLPEKIMRNEAVIWPRSISKEVDHLIMNFKEMVELLGERVSKRERLTDELIQLIESNSAPIFGVDFKGNVSEWNQAAVSVTGFERDDAIGRRLIEEFVLEDDREEIRELFAEAMNGGKPECCEVRFVTKGGDHVVLLLSLSPQRDADANLVGVGGICQDITERRLVQAELIQASKMATLGEMATAVAHELNQPLNIIRIASDSAIDVLETEDTDRDFLCSKFERISRQTERAASIIDHMRIFGRKTGDEPSTFDPRETLQGALSLMGEQLRLREIEVVKKLPESCRKVKGHGVQIEQVVVNLLTNARDAIEQCRRGGGCGGATPESRIFLEVLDDGLDDNLRILVRDHGGGVPERLIGRVFEPFFTTKEVGKGTGLGLSISYGIVTEMGGVLEIENIDGGACVTISLPVGNMEDNLK
jgi:PAS domain S-box-containing protein